MTTHAFDPRFFENALQLGGIRTGTLDSPQPMGGGRVRVAWIDTGAGLRFTVALDRGGDIFDAVHDDCALAYLTANDLQPPGEGYQREAYWLRSWAGGLVTTCGPLHIGAPQASERDLHNLHGHHSNTPAAVQAVYNPQPARGNLDMRLELIVRDTRMFGPVLETRRTIRCRLGEPRIWIEDTVTNCGDEPTPHHWLYHVNLGYPLLRPGARFVYRGGVTNTWGTVAGTDVDSHKQAPPPREDHAGSGEGGLIVRPEPDETGHVRVGLLDAQGRRALCLRFANEQLPHLAHWMHYGPRGSYVAGLEPFAGRLIDNRPTTAEDDDPHRLAPGATRAYALELAVLTEARAIEQLIQCDAPLGRG